MKEERDESDVFADRLELLLEAAASDVTEKLSQPLTEASDARQRRHQRRQDRRHRRGAVAEQQINLE